VQRLFDGTGKSQVRDPGPRLTLAERSLEGLQEVRAGERLRLDPQAVDKLRAAIQDPCELGYFDLFLARYLQTHGKRTEAIHYWEERIASTYFLGYCRTHAGVALFDLGLMPENDKRTLKKAAQAAPGANKQNERESNKEGKPDGAKPPGTAVEPSA
jgi:hypothetical protein